MNNQPKNKICLVTGANAGIGFATALGLAELGATVVMLCRSKQRGEAAQSDIRQRARNPNVHLLLADLASQSEIRELVGEFETRFSELHVLVNNAAIVPPQRQVTDDGLEMQFAVNHLAYFLLTILLLERLKAGAPSRVVNVSSSVHFGAHIDFDDLQSEHHYSPTSSYARTKLMNVLFTYELARRLDGSGVTANCLNPGVITTKLYYDHAGSSHSGDASLDELRRCAKTSLYLATSREVEGITGAYFSHSRQTPSSPASQDLETAARLWQISSCLTNLPST